MTLLKAALVQFAGLPILTAVWRVEGGAMAGFPGLDELFEGRHFDREIIVLCVRWYLHFKLKRLIERRHGRRLGRSLDRCSVREASCSNTAPGTAAP